MFPFDPPENIRKPLVFGYFQGDQKGTLGRKGVIVLRWDKILLRKTWQLILLRDSVLLPLLSLS